MTHDTNKKIKVSYELTEEAVEWISSEAKDNNMTIDEIVESLVFTVRFLTEALEEENNSRRSSWMLSKGGDA